MPGSFPPGVIRGLSRNSEIGLQADRAEEIIKLKENMHAEVLGTRVLGFGNDQGMGILGVSGGVMLTF